MAEILVLGEPGKEYVSLNLTVDEAATVMLVLGMVGGGGEIREHINAIYTALETRVAPFEKGYTGSYEQSFNKGQTYLSLKHPTPTIWQPRLKDADDEEEDDSRCEECGNIDFDHYDECSEYECSECYQQGGLHSRSCSAYPHDTNKEDT